MIAFLLQVAGVALAAGLGVSVIWPVVIRVAKRFTAARSADSLVVAGALPIVVSAGLAVALILPTALDALGVFPDHCHAHAHGLHLCGVHGGVHAPLLALGALLLGLFVVRGLVLATRLRRAHTDVRALQALGVRTGKLVEVPGESPLCHATGVLRPRVLLAAGLRARLGAPAVQAALAHEHAHLRRRDPAALVFLQLASLFALPGSGIVAAFRGAADEAADGEAAFEVGAVAVTDALVRMARLLGERSAPLSTSALAFGAHALELRVVRLLAAPAAPAKARGLALAGGIALAGLLLAALGAEPIHHVVEDLLHTHH